MLIFMPLVIRQDTKNMASKHFCYILCDRYGSTYNGYTTNPNRRLRQHNAIIKGGARFTTSRAKKSNDVSHWRFLAIIECEQFTKNTALSLEWSIKYPTNKRPRPAIYNGPEGRLKGLRHVFENPKFAHMSFFVHLKDHGYKDVLETSLQGLTNVRWQLD